MDIGTGKSGTGLSPVCRTGVARPHHRHADRSPDARWTAGVVTPDVAACRMGGLRTFHHRVRDVGCSLRRSPRASATPRRFDELFRARPAASPLLPRQYAFRPVDEDDAAWHGSVVGTVDRILPRQPLIAYFIVRPVAGFALYNWRLALLLIVLCIVFAVLTALIVRKTETLQSTVEQHYSDLAERASDTLGNIALVQSFSRLETEVAELRHVVERLLSAQMPV